MVAKTKPVAKKIVKKSSQKSAINKQPVYKSFRLCKETDQFVTFRVTKQTLYWTILLVYILIISLWVSNAQISALVVIP